MSTEKNENLQNEEKMVSQEKYLRLQAEFENYKKRVTNDVSIMKADFKKKMLQEIIVMNDEMGIAINALDSEQKKVIEPFKSKLDTLFTKLGIEKVQTDVYDSNLHHVVNIIDNGGSEMKIHTVLTDGYMVDGFVIRYPKVVLEK